MSARSLYRLAGLAMLVGGVISAISSFVSGFATDPNSPLNFWSSVVGIIGAILLLASLGTFYGTFARGAGALGVVGYILLFSAGALGALGGNLLGMIVFPWLAQAAPNLINSAPPEQVMSFFLFSGVLELIGGLAFGAAILVARAPERAAAVLMIIGVLVAFIGQVVLNNIAHVGDLGNVLLTLALAWMGLSLMTRHATEPAPYDERERAAGARVNA